MDRILLLAIGYICGLFQTGYLYGKLVKNMDIRKSGSGNAGATNSLRVLGIKAGIIVLLGDAMKAFIPCMIVRYLYATCPDIVYTRMLYIGLGAILGHNFPFYLNFKGGKGVASTAGIILATDLKVTLVCLIIFVLTVSITRYVSLGSILVMLTTIIMFSYYNLSGVYMQSGTAVVEFELLTLIIAGMSIYRHRANIHRLLTHSENKISFSSKH